MDGTTTAIIKAHISGRRSGVQSVAMEQGRKREREIHRAHKYDASSLTPMKGDGRRKLQRTAQHNTQGKQMIRNTHGARFPAPRPEVHIDEGKSKTTNHEAGQTMVEQMESKRGITCTTCITYTNRAGPARRKRRRRRLIMVGVIDIDRRHRLKRSPIARLFLTVRAATSTDLAAVETVRLTPTRQYHLCGVRIAWRCCIRLARCSAGRCSTRRTRHRRELTRSMRR